MPLIGATAGESATAMSVNSVEKLETSTSSFITGLNGASMDLVATICQDRPCVRLQNVHIHHRSTWEYSFLPSTSSSQLSAFFHLGHCLYVVGLRSSSLISTGWVVPLRGDWAIFRHAGSGWVDKSAISQGQILWNTPPRPGIKPGPQGWQTVRFIHSPTELSWLTIL